MIVNTSTSICKHLAEIIGSIGANDEDSIEELSEEKRAAGLGFSHGQTLLVRLPGTPLVSIAVGCVSYEPRFFGASETVRTEERGAFSEFFIPHPVLAYCCPMKAI